MPRNDNPNELANEIQNLLASARQEAASTTPTPSTAGVRVAKDGTLLTPGDPGPLGPDGQPLPTTLVPDATFHASGDAP